MLYDHTGTRVKKSGRAGTTYFPFAGYEVTGTVVTKYIRVGNETLAAKKGGDKLFYHNDHWGLGSGLRIDLSAYAHHACYVIWESGQRHLAWATGFWCHK